MAVSGWTFWLRACSKAPKAHNSDANVACLKMIWSFLKIQSPHDHFIFLQAILLAWWLSKLWPWNDCQWIIFWELNQRFLNFKNLMPLRPVWKWFGHSMNYNNHMIVFHIQFDYVQPGGHPNYDHEMAVSKWNFWLSTCSKAPKVHDHDAIEACVKMVWSFHEMQSPHDRFSHSIQLCLVWILFK